jgi:hypothetical protein
LMDKPSDTKLRTAFEESKRSESIEFIPTDSMRKAKAAFWSSHSDNPTLQVSPDLNDENKATLASQAGMPKSWWKDTKFIDWFNNREEFKQRLDYLAQLALDSAEEILKSRDAAPQAKVAMAKLVLEANGKANGEEKFMDARIAEMDKAELEKFIMSQMKHLTPKAE